MGHEYDDSEDEDGHEIERDMPELGHGGEGTELMPRMIEVLTEMKAIGAAAGVLYTVVWTDDGELFTFGDGWAGKQGHGGQ